jgi:hypothetical protein
LKAIDEKTDVIADKAVDSVKKSVSSFWRFASGYAQQVEELLNFYAAYMAERA